MKAQLQAQLETQNFPKDRIQLQVYLNLRYEGTDTACVPLTETLPILLTQR